MQSLLSNTTGNQNTASGYQSLYSNTTGYNNTASGYQSLRSNTTGYLNTASGFQSLYSNTTGADIVAVGTYALDANTTGHSNVAIGDDAMTDNSTGYQNVAVGRLALGDNTTATDNTAVGNEALRANTTGTRNLAVGPYALDANTTSTNSTAIGYQTLTQHTGSSGHLTAVGAYALFSETTGYYTTAVGYYAGSNLTSGYDNIIIGRNAQPTSATVSGECTLGTTTVTNLRCNDTTISSLSDERDKTNINDLPDSAGLELINKLRPVTFHWDRREWYDNGTPDGTKVKPDYHSWKANSGLKQGFIAQEVETAIAGEKCLEDSMVVTGTAEKKEFAPAHLLTNAIKAIQQLSAENKALLARIEALETPTA